LFSTGTWKSTRDDLGFKPGLGGGVILDAQPAGVADRPYPGHPIEQNSTESGHVKWIQARLNYSAHNKHEVLGGVALDVDGEFGDLTEKVVVAFQKVHGGEGLGLVGPKTWAWLNAVR
jgi:peptidoglycan hydrolase-like protein with peptidoglycan-binding domain